MSKDNTDRAEALMEDMNSKFDVMMEYVKDITPIKEKLNATFEEVGRIKEDTEIIKYEMKDVLARLDTLEQAMKLLDRDTKEIEELRRRVEKLEQAA